MFQDGLTDEEYFERQMVVGIGAGFGFCFLLIGCCCAGWILICKVCGREPQHEDMIRLVYSTSR